ncbi:MAG: agmatinase [Rhodoluna sp.]
MTEQIPRIITGEIVGQVDATVVPRFAGAPTFARLPRLDEVGKADIAVVGVPFDAGTSYRPGARFGPGHIREASRLLRPYNPAQDAHPFELAQVVDAGDLGVNPFNIEEALATIESGMDALTAVVSKVLTLGGDHTIVLPILRSLYKKYGPITVIHFDAHLDTWDTYFGAPYTHGTPFRRAAEEGLLDLDSCMHIGIRGPLYSKQDLTDDAKFGFQIVHTDDIDTLGAEKIIEKISKRVSKKPAYISIDIDVLDPAFAPGTGTPEAGGFSSREMLRLVRGLHELNLVGADIVEVAPAYDHAQVTGIAASHLAYDLITLMAKAKGSK